MASRGADRFVLWPHYFDARLARAGGRRVPEPLAVREPDAAWIATAAKRLGLDPQVEEEARHPKTPYRRDGRVLVARNGSKETVLRMVAQRMREAQDAGEHGGGRR